MTLTFLSRGWLYLGPCVFVLCACSVAVYTFSGYHDFALSPITASSYSTPLSIQRDSITGAYDVDAMQAKFFRNMTNRPVTYDVLSPGVAALNMVNLECADKGAFYWYANQNGMKHWVCDNKGEKKVSQVMAHVFRHSCMGPGGERGLMLDIGANSGFYGMLALRRGCEALFFDVQPGCHALIAAGLFFNKFDSFGRVVPFGVSSREATFKVGEKGCDGRFPASAHEKKTYNTGVFKAEAKVAPLATFVAGNQPVLLMKVDTEGNEIAVLQGSMEFFRKQLVQNAIVEVTPKHGFWKNVNMTPKEAAATFKTIAEFGYKVVSLWDWSVYDSPESIHAYILDLPFGQSDLWLTLELPTLEKGEGESAKILG